MSAAPDLDPVFTTARARAAGLSRRELESGPYRQVVRGVYARARVSDRAWVDARAALLVAAVDEAWVSHHTAARLYGAVVPDTCQLHVCVPPTVKRRRREGVVVHWGTGQHLRFRGLRVASPAQVFLELSRSLELVDLVVLGDSLVRRGRCSPADLHAAAAAWSGRGARMARRAAGLVRAGVDSPMETRCRLLRVLAGLPELETDVRLHDADGRLLRRLDAADRATRTAVEYDGRHHVTREEQWEADLGRREELEDADWRIMTLVSKDIFATPEQTLERQERLFRQRGIPVGRRSQEWRRYFRGRGHA
ncbi:hypothetical protein SGUI_0058 [Serinicoccus hydrothermalis]|uniref:DUF559 domain-containing protein n=1 Tax=Serinicoccus hydrothermalis TaxID=1758689 RepID=A0A1B1N7R7_9MICO|nr:hypothetical protein [Serinicoccus hydrothermalis]ANS77454.1 hypothetical protein SGUI_0058 [Serinicoccus hydrothermalis]